MHHLTEAEIDQVSGGQHSGLVSAIGSVQAAALEFAQSFLTQFDFPQPGGTPGTGGPPDGGGGGGDEEVIFF